MKFIEYYLEDLQLKEKDKDTIRNNLNGYNKFINWYKINVKSLEEDEIIKVATIENAFSYRRFLLENFKTSTVNLNIAVIKSFYTFLNKHNLLENNIFSGFGELNSKKDKRKKEVPTASEICELVKSFDVKLPLQRFHEYTSTRDKAILSILATTGIRIDNLLNVTMDRLFIVNEGYKIHFNEEETKGRVEVNLFITGITKELLDKWLSIRKNKQGNNTIFTSINGGKVGKKEYNECLKQRCKIAGIDKHLTAHCFRYACNNILLSNKIDVNDIKIMLGWKINKTEMLFHAYYDNLSQEKKFIEYSKMLNEIIYKSV